MRLAAHEAAFYARMQLVAGASGWGCASPCSSGPGPTRFEPRQGARAAALAALEARVAAFGYRQGVRNLPENASHRVRVDFRWYARGRRDRPARRRRSAACRQFVALPNLTARAARRARTKVPGVLRYRVAS